MSRFANPFLQYFDAAGDPLIDGKIYFFEPGTNTDKDTFADFALTIPNTNPVLLSAAGRAPNIWYSGAARAILTDSDDVQIEVRDPVGSSSDTAAFTDWNTNNSYSFNDLVLGSDGKYYVSLTGANTGNDPTSSPANWTQVKFIRVWNVNESYSIGDIGQGSDGLLYTSLTNTNTGNDPVSDAINWGPATASGGSAVSEPDYFSPNLIPITNEDILAQLKLYFDDNTIKNKNVFGPRFAWAESSATTSTSYYDVLTLTGPGVIQFLSVWVQSGTGGENFDMRIVVDGVNVTTMVNAFLTSGVTGDGYNLIGQVSWDTDLGVPLAENLPVSLENLPFNTDFKLQVKGTTGLTNKTFKAIYRYYGAKANPSI